MSDAKSAVTEKQIAPVKPRNLYEALTQFADANRLMLEVTAADNGSLPVLLTWNESRREFRALFGSQH